MSKESFCVVDLNRVGWRNRVKIELEKHVELYSNLDISSGEGVTYYEVVYRQEGFAFIVYYSTSKQDAIDIFNNVKITLNQLTKYITTNKLIVADNLQLIMQSLRINKNWTCAHVCACLGFDLYFSGKSQEIINSQVEPDRDSPMHLAIKSFRISTVRSILAQKPNLNVLNARQQSVLHYAAISTQQIAALILAQAEMMDRVLWKDAKNCTALHLACYIQKSDIVFEFLKCGLTVRMLTLTPPGETIPGKKQNKIVCFTEQDFDDIDCQDIFGGGCPMHWVKNKRLMDKLLSYGFSFNARNIQGDTPLHNMSKRMRLKCVISLLCAGANVNATNIFGDTPLHLSVKEDNLVVPQTLIVFDANIDAQNNKRETVRHVAAISCQNKGKYILHLLTAVGAKRCPPPKFDRCVDGCSFTGKFDGETFDQLYHLNQNYGRLFKNFLFGDILKRNENRTPEQIKKERSVNMLCLDGGGIKGLVSLQMLKEVERYLTHPLHHYFKWYAGTSTGSFICALLAIGKSLNQIRSTYFQIKDQIFDGDKPYDSKLFEKIIYSQVGNLRMEEIKSKFDKYLIIPSVIANRRPLKLHIFRSFPSADELISRSGNILLQQDIQPYTPDNIESNNIEVWKACRASAAAPTFFRSYNNLIDGGLVANNPTLDAMAEFRNYNLALSAVGKSEECQKLDLVVSVGTGISKSSEIETLDISGTLSAVLQAPKAIELLIDEATQTNNHVVTRAEAMCSFANIPFFRINTFLNDMIELNEKQDYKIIKCLWEAKRFMYTRRDQVKVLTDYLELCTQDLPAKPNKNSSKRKLSISNQTSQSTIHSSHNEMEDEDREEENEEENANVKKRKTKGCCLVI